MNFLKPAFLYLLLLIPLLLLLYVLRLRRKTRVVSSCLLWEHAIEDMKANTLFQRLRRNLLLPLQIIFLALAIFALARPFWQGKLDSAQNIIMIIDSSASMKATDVEGSRFGAAKSSAARMVDELGDGDRMMIIEARSSPRIVLGFTSDRLQLRDAINKMQPADALTGLTSAIQLASSIAEDTKKSEILLLSDGAVKLDKYTEQIPVPFRFIGFGKGDFNNVGITALEAGQSLDNPTEHQIFVALQNFGRTQQRKILLELWVNKKLIDVRELSLMSDERRSVVFDGIRGSGEISVRLDVKDDLEADNSAYYILREPDPIKVLLVSTGNLFLQEAIRTTPTVQELIIKKPEEYTSVEGYDVFVFDRFIPKGLPGKNFLMVNPEGDLPFGKLVSKSNNPTVIDWDKAHPVMQFVDLSSLQIDEVSSFDMPFWMKPLVESDTGAIAWLGEHNGQRMVVLPFDLRPRPSNNFQMLPAFPIFVSNAVHWLARADEATNRQLKPGEPIKLPITSNVDRLITVKKPDVVELWKSSIKYSPKDNIFVFGDTDAVGIYEVAGQNLNEKFAVNLLDAESNIKPSEIIQMAGQEIKSSHISAVSNREIWTGLLLAAVILLAAEWWVYHRRVMV